MYCFSKESVRHDLPHPADKSRHSGSGVTYVGFWLYPFHPKYTLQGFAGELDLDQALDRKPGPKQGVKQQGFEHRASKKREAKDSKFGK